MKKPDLLLDCDGVVADLVGDTVRHLASIGLPVTVKIDSWELRQFLNKDQLDAMFKLWETDGFADNLTLYPGVVEQVKRLKSVANVHFLTSHWDSSKTWVHDRTKWLCRHFGITSRGVTFSHDKSKWHGDIFVDDHTKNLRPWREKWAPDGLAYLWIQDYNETMPWDGNVLRNWDELYALCQNWEHFRELQRVIYQRKACPKPGSSPTPTSSTKT
jgi:5'(3')-deoxyribonucleotidase